MTNGSEVVHERLFEDGALQPYAILDGASIPDLLDHLYGEVRPEFICLYPGDVEPDMAEVGPYLVRLERDAEFTAWVVEEGWGKHWGVFALAPVGMHAMRGHLQRFLFVHDATGQPLYFRYYDPRVLRVYLPSCNADEVKDIFGPVSAFVLEGENPGAMTIFRGETGTLSIQQVALGTAR